MNFIASAPPGLLVGPRGLGGRTEGSSTPTFASAAVTMPARASARMTSTRSCRPTSNCLPGSVRATMRRVTVSTSMLSTPITVGASSSNSPSTGFSIARLAFLVQDLVDPVEVGAGRHRDVHHRACPVLGQVDRLDDLAVGNGQHLAVRRAQPSHPQVTFSTVPLASVAERR